MFLFVQRPTRGQDAARDVWFILTFVSRFSEYVIIFCKKQEECPKGWVTF